MALARLLRELDYDDCKEQFFSVEVVATFDKENNLIRVRRSWWENQSEWVQREVWKMEEPYLLERDFIRFDNLPPINVIRVA